MNQTHTQPEILQPAQLTKNSSSHATDRRPALLQNKATNAHNILSASTGLPHVAGPPGGHSVPRTVTTLLEQGSGPLNEDALLCDGNIFGVFDGASSLRGGLYDGHSGAWWASHISCAAVQAHSGSPAERMLAANHAIRTTMTAYNVPHADRLALWSTSAALIQLHGDSLEYAQIGDALILIIMQDGSYQLAAPYHNHDACTLALWQQYAQQGARNIHEAVGFHIEETRTQMNRTFGVLNGEAEAASFIATGSLPLKDMAHIICFTDGLHLPCDAPMQKGDFSEWVRLYLEQGLAGLHNTIRNTETTDPQCVHYPRFKQHDDTAAIAITF